MTQFEDQQANGQQLLADMKATQHQANQSALKTAALVYGIPALLSAASRAQGQPGQQQAAPAGQGQASVKSVVVGFAVIAVVLLVLYIMGS